MSKPRPLLAKWRSKDPKGDEYFMPRGFTFVGHIEECLRMTQFLFDEISFGRKLHEAMDLPLPYEEFRKLCLLAVMLHDLGKCGHEFQQMLWGLEEWFRPNEPYSPRPGKPFKKGPMPRYKQRYRHETLTMVILNNKPAIRDWLLAEAGSERNFALVAAAAYGHHIKTDHEVGGTTEPARIYYAQMSADLAKLCVRYGFSPFPALEDTKISPNTVQTVLDGLWTNPKYQGLQEDRTSAAIKWVTILGDVLGSMTPKNPKDIPQYARKLREQIVQALQPRSCDYKGRIPKWGEIEPNLHSFQNGLAACTENAIALISCGGGKTTGAYLWADPAKRLIFCTPTTGTATQIHIDYGDANKDGNRHSRSGVDDSLGANPPGPKDSVTEQEEEARGILQDLYNLHFEVTHTTVDQVIGLLSFARKSILWLMYLVESQVVFDEVHMYDPILAGWHQRFLNWFPGIRTLHMTATLSAPRLTLLQKGRPSARIFTEPLNGVQAAPVDVPRYRIHVVKDAEEARQHFNDRSLWVVNTIRQAQSLGSDFSDAVVYHSRFRYEDRVERQRDLVGGFRGNQPIRAIATQVAEVSLDISANVLISEIADPASMMQRAGRVNRTPFPTQVCDLYFYMPEKGFPYSQNGLISFRPWLTWLKRLEGRDLSQRDLNAAFVTFPDYIMVEEPVSHILRTARSALREDKHPKVSCILLSDAKNNPSKSQMPRFEIPCRLPADIKANLHANDLVCHYHYIIGTPYDNLTYCPRLGLIAP